ncbi:MAG: hypothetical protein EBZ13_08745 [Planctomycetia bacterium]|nr:hypothetical protein [Planctomycetia bacterium]
MFFVQRLTRRTRPPVILADGRRPLPLTEWLALADGQRGGGHPQTGFGGLLGWYRSKRQRKRQQQRQRPRRQIQQDRPEGIGAEPLEIRLAFSGTQLIDTQSWAQPVSGETAHEAAVVATTVGVPAGSAVWNVVGGEELLRAAASDSLTAAIQEGELLLQSAVGEAASADWGNVFSAASSPESVRVVAEDLATGRITIEVEVIDGARLGGTLAGYAAVGHTGEERIYVNAAWLNSGPDPRWVTAVLLEELGHAIDHRVSPRSMKEPQVPSVKKQIFFRILRSLREVGSALSQPTHLPRTSTAITFQAT